MLRWIHIESILLMINVDWYWYINILMLKRFASYLTHPRHILHCHNQWRLDSHNFHSQHLQNGKSAAVVVSWCNTHISSLQFLESSFWVKLWWNLLITNIKTWKSLTWAQDRIKTGRGRSWVAIVVVVRPTWALVVVWTWTLAKAWVWTPTESLTCSLVESGTLVESSTSRLTPGLVLRLRVWNVNFRFKIWFHFRFQTLHYGFSNGN